MVAEMNENSAGATTGFSPQVAHPTPGFQATGRMPSGGSDDGRRLVVGRDIVLSGTIGACDNLIVEGRVEAELNDSKRIEISDSGSFKGSVEIDEAVIAGHFEGSLTVRDRLVVKSTGRIEGVIRYGELEIQSGGVVRGDIDVFGPGNSVNMTPETGADDNDDPAENSLL